MPRLETIRFKINEGGDAASSIVADLERELSRVKFRRVRLSHNDDRICFRYFVSGSNPIGRLYPSSK